VAINLMSRHLYYTDWGDDAKLVRCYMDGSWCTVLLHGLQNPNGVTVDDSTVYVVDSQLKHGLTQPGQHSSVLLQLTMTSANDRNWTATNLSQINVGLYIYFTCMAAPK